jgi:hypothetical protein
LHFLTGGPIDQKGIIPVVNTFITSVFPANTNYSIKEINENEIIGVARSLLAL